MLAGECYDCDVCHERMATRVFICVQRTSSHIIALKACDDCAQSLLKDDLCDEATEDNESGYDFA